MHAMPTFRWAATAALTAALLFCPSCKSSKAPDGGENAQAQKLCDCPKEATQKQTEIMSFLRDALLPRTMNEADRQAALKSVEEYDEGFFSGPGGSWGSCQFRIGDELLTKILEDKEARAKSKEFEYRTDTPPEQFRTWFDTPAVGIFENKKHVLETCQITWWSAGKHPGDYFRSWERTTQSPRWSVVVKVCPVEKGLRWVFFRCTAE